jgi:predicted nucleic acid-binding protein
MDCLADTNVLVRTVDRLHSHHSIAVKALDRIMRTGGHVYVAAQNLIEFWSVCSRSISRNGLGLSTSETEKAMSPLEQVLLLLPEVPAIFPEWRRLVTAHAVAGFDVFDARLVAVMRVYGIRDLLTFNTADFVRYPGINVVDPSTIR